MRILQFLRKFLARNQLDSVELPDYIEPSSFASHACSDFGDSDSASNTISYLNAEIDLPDMGTRFGYYFLAEGGGIHDKSQFTPDAVVLKSITESLLDAPIEILAKRYTQLSDKECESAIATAFQEANKALRNIASETAYATMTGAFIRGSSITFGHVGANRLYWIDRNAIHRLTRDHTVRMISNDERFMPLVNIYGFLGKNQPLMLNQGFDVSTHKDISDGYLLLCTWRLWESVNEDDLRNTVMTSTSLEKACTRLLQSAGEPVDERGLAIILGTTQQLETLSTKIL